MAFLAGLTFWWLWHPLEGIGYQFWSGLGSDFSEITLILGLVVYLRRHNCQVRGCWRLQWKHTAAGDLVCRRHHPCQPKTHAQVLADHHQRTPRTPTEQQEKP